MIGITKSESHSKIVHCIFNSLLTEFVTASVRAPSTYRKTTSCDGFILMGQGDPNNVEKGFLQSGLLVKVLLYHPCPLSAYISIYQTYSNIFISPSSSESFDDEDENGAARKPHHLTHSQRKATKCNVANLLSMDGQVTLCSIAYAAVLVMSI